MSYTASSSLKCRSFSQCQKSFLSSKRRRRSSHIRTRSRHTLKMSEKMSDISQSVNQLINRLSQSFNQLISRHQLFRHHSGKHLFNHYILIYHTIHLTLQSISSIISTVNHSTDQSISTNQSISMHQSIRTRSSNHRGHHTSSIKFGLSRKHLNRIYLNQFNHLHLNHLNHLHLRSHQRQHLNSSRNQFISVNHSMPRMMIIRGNWHYWTKFIRRTKNSVTRAAILTSKYWSFMTNVDARDYSSMRICRVSRLCCQVKHLITSIQICNFAIHFMTFVST
jgi:hypothetical protein